MTVEYSSKPRANELQFAFATNRSAWDFVREIEGECVGSAGFPSLDGENTVRVLPKDSESVLLIAAANRGEMISPKGEPCE